MPSIEGLINFCEYFDITFFDQTAEFPVQYKSTEYMNRIQALNQRIANLTVFNGDIVLNTKTTAGRNQSQKKTVDSVELHGAKYDVGRGYVADGFYAEIFYTDGSYKYEYVPTSAFSYIDFSKLGKQTVKWSDEWGSYEATVKSA